MSLVELNAKNVAPMDALIARGILSIESALPANQIVCNVMLPDANYAQIPFT